MRRDPQHLSDARALLARAATADPPSPAELWAARRRLHAMRAHPACGPAESERIGGALVVLDVLALEDAARPTALAG